MKKPVHSLPQLISQFAFTTEQGALLGDKRIRLLEEIERQGAITRAAKAVPLSYKAAWDAIDAMNNLSPSPLVARIVGGRDGGGAALTDQGRRVIALYRAMEGESQRLLNQLATVMGPGGPTEAKDFLALLRRMSMKISARNQFSGPITALREGAVNFEVRLRLDDANELVANITKESAETLELAIGKEVLALIKSSSVMIMTDKKARTSARNQLWGETSVIHKGAVNSEVGIKLPSGRTVTAIITDDSVAHLGLAVGKPACAVFKASSVILAVLN